MDLPETSPQDYALALADLAKVNRFTLTHRPILRWLDKATDNWSAGHRLSVLDVASGHGDLLRAIHLWASQRGFKFELHGIDLNPRSAIEAAAATPPGMKITWHTGDVFAHTPDPAPDFIITSQFTHHLDDAQVVALLRWMERHAKRGWFVSDLHRHIIPYYGFRFLCWAMRWHRIVRIDGTISIARSFRAAEWWALAARAGVAAQVRWHMMFRLCVGRLK
jgi:2-polyprenyl-3-methyl-5-hydroxy-6-metoxy-1,4-benzoquinol methylase